MLVPRLRTYLKSPRPGWPEIVDAADWLRGSLGVSKSLWGEACLAMGREQARRVEPAVADRSGSYGPDR
jgi:replication initiation protein RepC